MATARFVPKGTGKTVIGKGRFVQKPTVQKSVYTNTLAKNKTAKQTA